MPLRVATPAAVGEQKLWLEADSPVVWRSKFENRKSLSLMIGPPI